MAASAMLAIIAEALLIAVGSNVSATGAVEIRSNGDSVVFVSTAALVTTVDPADRWHHRSPPA